MIITLEKRAIVFTLNNNSINLNPLLLFIDNSFKRVKHFSNATAIFNEASEAIKKKYLLKWAYKIHRKNFPDVDNAFFHKLIASYELPIHVITSSSHKSITQIAIITIEQIDSFEISVSLNQNNESIVDYFKLVFKDTMVRSAEKTIFRITIKTKSNLSLLKSVLSKKEISSIPVTFITHGLNFKRLHAQEVPSAEFLYREKLRKSYKILNVSDTTTPQEMKKNYKDMLRKYHPDIVYNESENMVELYTKRFQAIQIAYELLKEHHKVA